MSSKVYFVSFEPLPDSRMRRIIGAFVDLNNARYLYNSLPADSHPMLEVARLSDSYPLTGLKDWLKG